MELFALLAEVLDAAHGTTLSWSPQKSVTRLRKVQTINLMTSARPKMDPHRSEDKKEQKNSGQLLACQSTRGFILLKAKPRGSVLAIASMTGIPR